MNAAAHDEFPPDYDERVDRVCNAAAMELRSCRGDLLAQLAVCCRYFESGDKEGISHGELIDYLGVSSDSVLDRAGYSSEEAQCVMNGLTMIKYDKQGKPQPPTSLPDNPPLPPEETTFNL
jgi:hypothetical protein